MRFKFWLGLCFFLVSGLAFSDTTLERLSKTIERDRAQFGRIAEIADQMAERIANGANLWAAGNPGFARELTMRAGGFIMIEKLQKLYDGSWGVSQYMGPTRKFDRKLKPGDVILFAHDSKHSFPQELEKDFLKTTVFFGKPLKDLPTITSSAEELGVSPSIGQALSGMFFSAELFSALTRRAKIPTLFQSVGEFGGFYRIEAHYWPQTFFHAQGAQHVSKIASQNLAQLYADKLQSILTDVLSSQFQKIKTAGQWISKAVAAGKTPYMFSMGHIFPSEITDTEIGKLFKPALSDSGRPFGLALIRDLNDRALDLKLNEGDVVVHIGYQHYPEELYDWVNKQKAKLVYVSLYSSGEKPDSLHIDPRWPWSDASVKVEGLETPVLAVSGLVNSAIAWDIYLESKK